MALVTITQWQNFLAKQESIHILQTAAWGLLKAISVGLYIIL